MSDATGGQVTVVCTCGAKIRLPASAAGRRGKCPKCHAAITVPGGAASEAASLSESRSQGSSIMAVPADAGGSGAGMNAGVTVVDGKIRFACACGGKLKMPLATAGRRAKCPRCGAAITVPQRPAEAGGADDFASLAVSLEHGERVDAPAQIGGAGDLFELAPLKTPKVYSHELPASVDASLPPKTCPSCHKTLPGGAKLCVECGIDLKTGRSILMVDDSHIDAASARAEATVTWLSWLFWSGIYPFASEAFGTRTPWVIRGVGLFTILTSIWYFFVVIYNPAPSRDHLMLMHWCGDRDALSTMLEAEGYSEDEIAEVTRDSDAASVEYRPYQLLTSAFLHNGPIHLAGNLLFLFVLGSRVNALAGNILALILYPLFAILASIADMIATADSPFHPTLGASGAIMGLAGMYLVLFPVHKVHNVFWWRWGLMYGFRLSMKIFAVPGWVVVLFWIMWDVIAVVSGMQGEVANWAHLGGFIAGVIIGLALLCGRLVNARGGDILSAILGRYAWPLVGHPNRPGWSLW